MPGSISTWLDGVGSAAFALSAVAFVTLNGIGIAAVFLTRDRQLVNRWTSRFLAANLVLLGTGLGIPLATLAARTALQAFTAVIQTSGPNAATSTAGEPEPGIRRQ